MLLFSGAYLAFFGLTDMIHVANVLYLASYSVRDILWLRILTVVAALCLLPYYFGCGAEPLWEAIAWNGLFIGVNLFQILLLVRERWPVQLEGLERDIYERIFHTLTPGEFQKLLKLGSWKQHAPEAVLVGHGTVVDEMMVLCEGEAKVLIGDDEVARLKEGQFVGEMSFLTQKKASANVVSAGETTVLSWPQRELQAYLDKNGGMAFKVQGVLGQDLVRKLHRDPEDAEAEDGQPKEEANAETSDA